MAPFTPRTTSREALLEGVVGDVLERLEGFPETSRVREQRAKARSYENTIGRWSAVPPTNAQFDAIFELVVDLQARALEPGRRRHP